MLCCFPLAAEHCWSYFLAVENIMNITCSFNHWHPCCVNISLAMYLGMEFLDHVVWLYLRSWAVTWLSNVEHYFTFPTPMCKALITTCPHWCYGLTKLFLLYFLLLLFYLFPQVGIKWHLLEILTCVFKTLMWKTFLCVWYLVLYWTTIQVINSPLNWILCSSLLFSWMWSFLILCRHFLAHACWLILVVNLTQMGGGK